MGTFSDRKLFEADILLSMDNCGPRMCVGYCFIHSGCVAIHYNAKHLVCRLLSRAVICKNKREWKRKRLMFADIKDWTMDESLCWPNPCNMHQKCVIVDQMYPICVRFKPTIAPIPETKEITTNTTEMSRTSTEQETNTEAGSTSIEILSTSNTPSVPHTSQDELVTYIKCGESRSNDDDANEADTMIYNDTTDGSIMAATNVSTSGITDITITNNGTLETETTTE
ncbi:unnamed protein product [Mytilus edulis]|uniref:Uncharacterized protein n=1 Tax=Mytilus edulis TaxID=6550 RepID=A0A8S3U816_MYTED|nr:unnamed protein product [Mytilus edulis]